ncbi:MAG: hypothetical protein ABIS14_08730, partial [Sphingomonas sp.]
MGVWTGCFQGDSGGLQPVRFGAQESVFFHSFSYSDATSRDLIPAEKPAQNIPDTLPEGNGVHFLDMLLVVRATCLNLTVRHWS